MMQSLSRGLDRGGVSKHAGNFFMALRNVSRRTGTVFRKDWWISGGTLDTTPIEGGMLTGSQAGNILLPDRSYL